MMKIKLLLITLTMIFFQSESKSSVVASTSSVVASTLSIASRNFSHYDNNYLISLKFDHIVACRLKYKKTEDGNYTYFCPNPPKNSDVLFIGTIISDRYWPATIIYYMQEKKNDEKD